jgi:carboxymethylenebutenolidase
MENKAIKADWLTIDAQLRGWYAAPESGGPYSVVVCFIEAFGITDHFKNIAQRFAEAGFCAVVPDIYHGDVFDYGDMDGALGKIKSLDEIKVTAEAAAAIDALQGHAECDTGYTMLVGFCLGGRLAFRAHAALGDRVSGAACFYGGGIAPREDHFGREPLLGHVDKMRAPLELFYGGEDQSIRPDEHGRIAEALGNAGVGYGLHVYPEAGHAFFCDDRSSYNADVAEDSWELTIRFFRQAARR